MKLRIYTIHDKKADIALGPFFVRHEIDAVRRVLQTLQDPSTSLAQYPEDYDLEFVGMFDEVTHKLEAPDAGMSFPLTTMVAMLAAKKGEKNVA